MLCEEANIGFISVGLLLVAMTFDFIYLRKHNKFISYSSFKWRPDLKICVHRSDLFRRLQINRAVRL